MQNIMIEMQTQDINEIVQQNFGINLSSIPADQLPENNEELQLHMQLDYKQAIEIAEEQALATVFNLNNYELTKKRFYYDLTVLGMGVLKIHSIHLKV